MKYWLLCCIGIGLVACSSKNADEGLNEEHSQLATQVSIFASKDNQKEWILLADTVNFSDLQNATLNNPSLLLKQDGEDSARVTGKTGSFNYTEHVVSIEGNARIQSFTEQLTITAPSFSYNIDDDRVWSDGKTTVTRGDASVIAKGGIVTDSKFNQIEFKKQTIQLPSNTQTLKRK